MNLRATEKRTKSLKQIAMHGQNNIYDSHQGGMVSIPIEYLFHYDSDIFSSIIDIVKQELLSVPFYDIVRISKRCTFERFSLGSNTELESIIPSINVVQQLPFINTLSTSWLPAKLFNGGDCIKQVMAQFTCSVQLHCYSWRLSILVL